MYIGDSYDQGSLWLQDLITKIGCSVLSMMKEKGRQSVDVAAKTFGNTFNLYRLFPNLNYIAAKVTKTGLERKDKKTGFERDFHLPQCYKQK